MKVLPGRLEWAVASATVVDVPATLGADEPVTDITAYDMAVWCNAWNELMDRKPEEAPYVAFTAGDASLAGIHSRG